jgi:hypothetical protein
MKTKVAIIELSHSHDECIYSQIQFLLSDGGYDVTVICNEIIYNRLEANLSDVEVKLMEIRRGINLPFDIIRLRSFLVKKKFDKVIFNTATGNIVKLLMLLPFPNSIEFLGVVHNIGKLTGSTNQDIISRKVKKYYVLSEYLKDNAPSKYNIEYFYPMFFPGTDNLEIEKSNNETWICIPGQIERRRRDYDGLFQQLSRHKLKENIKFILLGSGDTTYIKNNIERLGLNKQFVWWDSYVGTPIFENYIEKSDYILPLIHPNHESFTLYQNQISGTFNLAYGYGKPMLMEESLQGISDFDGSVFYKTEQLIDVLNTLQTKPINPYNSERWRFETQKNKYINLLN